MCGDIFSQADFLAAKVPAASHVQYFAGGPLLFPFIPFTFDGSCCCTVGFCGLEFAPEPTVAPDLAAGPLLLPGWPAMPAPEFCELGALDVSGVFVWANAAEVDSDSDSASTRPLKILMTYSPLNEFHLARVAAPVCLRTLTVHERSWNAEIRPSDLPGNAVCFPLPPSGELERRRVSGPDDTVYFLFPPAAKLTLRPQRRGNRETPIPIILTRRQARTA